MRQLLTAVCISGAMLATASAADDLSTLSTGFDDDASLVGWTEHLPEGFTPKWREPLIEDGNLVLEPISGGWFEELHGGHLYKAVDGDFIVTTRINVAGTKEALPQTLFSLAGLFIRAPREFSVGTWAPGRENWLFFSIGTSAPAGTPQFEIKTTTNSLSTLKIHPAPTGWVELRVARHAELFTLLHRAEGEADWAVADQMIRPDLPQTLNVGLTAYADWGSVAPIYPDMMRVNTEGAVENNADLIARVDRIDFRRPAVGRIPIANIDAPAFIDAIETRRADLLAD
ncbi:MAG: hypothetical protein AAF661_09755 [Pseudomonadota bacterium]